jgi:hypothetical protein
MRRPPSGFRPIAPGDVFLLARRNGGDIDERLAKAKADGLLRFFNSEYRRRRLAAREHGRSFMNYWTARDRLRRALAEVAAGESPPAIVARVFGGEGRRPLAIAQCPLSPEKAVER